MIIALFALPLQAQKKYKKKVHKTIEKTTTQPLSVGTIDAVQSKELAETRILNIYLPDGYSNTSDMKYPVIYLLDGSVNEDFLHIAGLVQFQSMIQAMPNSIVVGIANVDRKRDFTYPTSIRADKVSMPSSGNSDKFIAFVEKELEPYIEKKYKTNGTKTLIGQSLGGLLATEILLKKPALFNNYIIISPSLWWDDESLLNQAPELLKNLPDSPTTVFLAVGTEGKQMEKDAAQLSKTLKKVDPKKLTVYWTPMPEENHLTILHNSVYKALPLVSPRKK